MKDFSNLVFLYHIIGCIVFFLIGEPTQDEKDFKVEGFDERTRWTIFLVYHTTLWPQTLYKHIKNKI